MGGLRLALGVALLGALGSVCRWLVAVGIQRHVGAAFPAGTFVVNALGSSAIGVVMGFFTMRGTEASGLRVALTAGFLGGFTTYSSFAFETLLLLQRRSVVVASLNVLATVVVCLVGCALGVLLGRAAGR